MIKEAYPAKDGRNTICLLDIEKDDRDTVVIVSETVEQIHEKLRSLHADTAKQGS